MKKILFASLAVATLTGCYKTTISLDGSSRPSRGPDYVRWHHHFIGGLIDGSGTLDPNEKCTGDASVVQTMTAWYQPFITSITSGIYTPTLDKVWCSSGGVTLSPAGEEASHGDVIAAEQLVEQDQQGVALQALLP